MSKRVSNKKGKQRVWPARSGVMAGMPPGFARSLARRRKQRQAREASRLKALKARIVGGDRDE